MNSSFNEKDFNSYVEGIKDGPLDNFNIQVAVKHIIKWEELSRYLELSDPEVETIKHDYSQDYNEQKFQCIKCWVKKNGKDATLITLLQHIYFNLQDKTIVMNIVDDLTNGSKRSADFGKENITNTDKPLHKEKDFILKDKFFVTDTVENRKHASKKSGDFDKENTNQPLPKLKHIKSAPCSNFI